MFDPQKHKESSLIPVGRCLLEIAGVETTQSKAGNPMLTFSFEVLGDPDNDGRTLVAYYPLAERSMWKLSEICYAVGQTEAFDEKNEDEVRRIFCGKRVQGMITHEERTWEGRVFTNERVGQIRALDDPNIPKLAETNNTPKGDPFMDDVPF